VFVIIDLINLYSATMGRKRKGVGQICGSKKKKRKVGLLEQECDEKGMPQTGQSNDMIQLVEMKFKCAIALDC